MGNRGTESSNLDETVTRIARTQSQVKPKQRGGLVGMPSPCAGLGEQKSYTHFTRALCRDIKIEKLSFVPEINGDHIEPLVDKFTEAVMSWGAMLLGVVMGNEITIATLTSSMRRSWPFETPKFLVTDIGIIVMKFRTREQRDWVLEQGP